MKEFRKWISTSDVLPKEGQKIYYFCDFLGIFMGEFHIIESSYANPNKFSSNHGVLDSDDVNYWMPYDHSLEDMIPLPPDYKKVDTRRQQSIINGSLDLNFDEVEIPQQYRQINFSYQITGDINEQVC